MALLAQTTAGSISGTVIDPNAALVPGAKIEAKHLATGMVSETVSTESGIYSFPSLQPGGYTLTVTHSGFKQLVRTNIDVLIGSRVTLELKLELGESKESVEVRAEAPVLETTSAQRGTNVVPEFMNKLPIYSGGIRNAGTFVSYMPGVNTGAETSISGSGGRAKEVLIDGGSNTSPESGGMVMQNIGYEAYNEFKLTTGSYSAELGRFGGGVEMYSTKSGTNDIHGSGYWGLRRDIFNAAGFVSNSVVGRTPGYRGKERFNEVAGTIGGPVFIPKVYDGRNKTFFFFTYSRDMRPASFGINTFSVPTAAQKAGDFSALNTTLFDPASTVGQTRTPFSGNIIPSSRFSSVSAKYVSYIPAPTSSALQNNYTHADTSTYKNYIWTIKGDHQFNAAHRLSVFYQYYDDSTTAVTTFDGPLGSGITSPNKPVQFRANHDWILRPTMLLHTMFSYSSTRSTWNTPQQKGFMSKLGMPNQGGDSDTAPLASFNDSLYAYTPYSQTNGGKVDNGGQWNYTYHMGGYLSWMRGKHEIKLGWEVRRLQTNGQDAAGTSGNFTFANGTTADLSNLTKSGNAFASLLLGQPQAISQAALPITNPSIRYGYHAGYLQDNWRVSSRLTLELGVRYEVPKNWHILKGNYSAVDPSRANPSAGNLPGALVFAGNGMGREGKLYLYPTDYTDIGPRLGFAYRVAEKTVLRGGWGIYYQTLGNGGCGCSDGFNYTATVKDDNYGLLGNTFSAFKSWDSSIPYPIGFVPPPSLTPDYINGTANAVVMGDSFGKAPRVFTWSATLQHEIKGFLLEAGYVGNRGHGLASVNNLNQLPLGYMAKYGAELGKKFTIDGTGTADLAGYKAPYTGFAKQLTSSATYAQSLKKFPQYTGVSGMNSGQGLSWYDSLQIKVEKRKGALLLMGNYTYSKSLARMHYRQIFGNSGQMYLQDAYNPDDAKSFLYFHQAHVMSILSAYDLPFGKGKRLLGDTNKVVDAIVSGWSIAGIQKYRSGNLIPLTASTNQLVNLGSWMTKANMTGKAIKSSLNRTDLEYGNTSRKYFNSGADVPFANPATYAYGTASVFQPEFRQPPVMTENMTLMKKFSIAERYKFIWRADAFNVFNRTNFGVYTTWTNANFGYANGVQSGARIITMALRLEF
jgi:hypothetical protein